MAGRIKGILDFVSETIKDAKYDRAEFDPRFYPGGKLRVKDAPEYRANVIDTGTMIPQERLALQDLEGRPYFTTMSDRTAAGGLLEGIGNKPLAHPIRLTGGQDYMRDDTGELWASGAGVVPNMVKAAKELEDQYGSSPVFMPWRMAPSGGDFAHMTGQTMLSWAAGNMPKVYKKQLDADMKKFVPDWAGIDDPKSLEQYGALPDTQRKSAMNMLDVEYRNKGGISQTQARLAVSDQSQLLSPVSGFQNVGEVDLKRGVLEGAGNATYPSVLAGKYFGTLDTDVTAMDLNPERYARALKKDGTFATGPQGPDSLDTRAAPRRAMEVGNWGGLIDEPLLRRLSEKGFKINSGVIPGIATALVGASSLYSSDSDAGVVSSTLNAARKIGDDYTSLLDSAAAKQPMDSAILPGQGGQTFVKPDQEATARMYDEFRNQINSVGENVFDSSPISGAVEIGGREGVKGISRYTFPREYAGETSKIGVDSPDIIEFASDETGARLFREKLMEGKDASKYGSSVTAYDADEYKGMRLFLSEDGSTGYALKPDGDIVSAFSAGKYEGVGPHLIMHGIEQGGKKLDAFDTVLPDLYAQMGFKEAARVKFDPAEAPDDWNMLTYKKFNEGQPDISLMSLDDAPATPVSPNMVDDYGTALDLQSQALAEANGSPLTAFSDKGNKWLQKLLAEAEQADLPQSAIDQGYSPSILQHVGEPGLQGYDLNAAAVANENSVSGMYNYPTKRESDRYLDQMQRFRDKSLEQYETVTRGDKAFVIGGDKPTPEMEQQFLSELEDAFQVKYSELPEHKQGWFDEKVDQFLRYGDLTASPLSRDAKNRIYRAGGADVLVRNGREIVSLKPEQVRSPKAQFNIDDQGSNNFMASVAGAGVLGALALPQNSEAEEYTEAPVIEEQSFGSMVQEYGDINRRAKAADDKKFGLLMAEEDRLGAMSRAQPGSAWGKASPELSEYRRSQLLPGIAEIGMGGADAVVSGLDFLSNIPGAAATMNWQGATPIRDRLGGLLDYTFVDERDQRARDSARLLGGLLSPI